jgi:carboxymethylenebutenolidase
MQSTFRAGDHEIRIDMHEPKTSSAHPAIILMHGSGGNIGFWLDRLAPYLNSAGVALYAPHYFDRTNTVRADLAAITDGVHVPQWLSTLDAAVTFASTRPNVDPGRIAIIGISLGAFLSLAFAAELSASSDPVIRRRIRALVDLSGGLVDPYAARATSAFPATLIVHGEADNVVPISHAHKLDKLLSNLNVKHETRMLPNEGHWFSGAAQMQLLLAVGGFLSKNL